MEVSASRAVIAVVEDDPSARSAMTRLLDVCGFEPAAFESGEAFIEATPSKPLLCLIVDVHLGGMSGIDLQRRLRINGVSTPIIVITAQREEAIRARAEREGCVAFLWKPVEPSALLQAIRGIPAASLR
jgi:FixJ family two-component response regulator